MPSQVPPPTPVPQSPVAEAVAATAGVTATIGSQTFAMTSDGVMSPAAAPQPSPPAAVERTVVRQVAPRSRASRHSSVLRNSETEALLPIQVDRNNDPITVQVVELSVAPNEGTLAGSYVSLASYNDLASVLGGRIAEVRDALRTSERARSLSEDLHNETLLQQRRSHETAVERVRHECDEVLIRKDQEIAAEKKNEAARRRSMARDVAVHLVGKELDRSSPINQAMFGAIPELDEILYHCDKCDHEHWAENKVTVYDDNVDPSIDCCMSCAKTVFHKRASGRYHTSPETPEEPLPEVNSSSITADWISPEDLASGILPGYHHTKINYPEDLATRSDVLGIELETYQKQFEKAWAYFRKLRFASDGAFKFERDGSLDGRYGVELASIPYTLDEIRNTASGCVWPKLLKWSKENGGTAWDAGPNYGMHISLNKRMLTPIHTAKIVRFFASQKELCEKIAGRSESSYAKFTAKRRLPQERIEDSKYLAAAIRGDRIEVRIFRASLNWTRFVRNCEFVDAVRMFTQFCSIRKITEKEFIDWLSTPSNRAYYPLLYKFLVVDKRKGKILPAVDMEKALTVDAC